MSVVTVQNKESHENPEQTDRAEAIWLALSPVLGQLSIALLLALAAMFVFVKLAHEVADDETRRFDVAVLSLFSPYRGSALFEMMTAVSWLAGGGPQTVLVFLTIATFAFRRRWLEAGTMLLADVGGLGVIIGLKHLFHRPRPEEVFSSLGYSFPSGHSFFAVVVYGLLAYWLTRDAPRRRRRTIWIVTLFAILLVGFSRVFVGEHFPSDVAAGYAVAVPWLWGCLALPNAFHRRGRDITPDEVRERYRSGKQTLQEAMRFLPDLTQLASGLARDKRVPRLHRVSLWLIAGYLTMPLDLIPDFIPVVGRMDDLFLARIILCWASKGVPQDVVQQHWAGDVALFDLLERVHTGIRNLMNRT